MALNVSVVDGQWKNKVRIFKLEGQLDSKTIPELELSIKREKKTSSPQTGTWVMDLSQLTYVSSAGVAIFIGLGYESDSGGALCFYGAGSKVFSVFELLGLTEVFRFFDSEEQAKTQSGL